MRWGWDIVCLVHSTTAAVGGEVHTTAFCVSQWLTVLGLLLLTRHFIACNQLGKKNRSAQSEWQRTYWKGTKFATFLILKPLLFLRLLQITYNSLVTPVPCQLFTQLLPICLPSYAQRPSLNTSTACSFYKPSKRPLPHMFMRNQLLINSQEAKSDTYVFVFTHEYVSNVYILKYVQVYLISLFPLFPHSLYARAPI